MIGIAADVFAQASVPPPAPISSGDNAAKAQALVDEGRQRHGTGDLEGALKAFLAAKKLYPETTSTLNAAICLEQLGRYDEALELYEDVLINFPSGLTDENKAGIGDTIASLRQKLGVVEIFANVRAFTVFVDGRRRIELRSGGRLRLLGGNHSLKIVHDEYEPLEITLQVDPGASVKRTIVLKPFGARLRVEADTGAPTDFEVVVDGVRVGKTPWEGQVSPGPHIVRTEKDNLGSMPVRVEADEGKLHVLRLGSRPLGPPVYVLVEPRTAGIKLNHLSLGAGRWTGRLPLGAYTLGAREPGYRSGEVPLRITEGDEPLIVRMKLELDPSHPRWPKRTGHFWLSTSTGFGWAPSLGSSAEVDCAGACTNYRGAFGFVGGILGGYEFPSNLSLDLEIGFAWLQASFGRVKTDRFPLDTREFTVEYRLHDALRLAGPFASGGASYRFRLGDRFGLSTGVRIGMLIAYSWDSMTGIAVSGDTMTNVMVEGAGQPVRSATVFLLPEITALWRLRSFEMGLGVRIGSFLRDGPRFEHGSIRVTNPGDCSSADPSSASCAPDSPAVKGERAYGPFILLSPQLRVGYVFP